MLARRILAAVAVLLATATCSTSAAAPPRAAAPVVAAPAARSAGALTTVTVSYYTADADQNADVTYDPAWVGSSRPAVVVVHGGSWGNGSKESTAATAQRFAEAGFVVMNVNYRLTQTLDNNVGTPFPAQRIDVELAVRWLKANAATYGASPDRIALYGFSAGGHLAVLGSLYYNSVRAVVSVAGVLEPSRVALVSEAPDTGYDGDPWLPSVAKLQQWQAVAMTCAYYPTWTNGWGGCGDRWRTFEPSTYLAPGKPAQYLMMGDSDPAVPMGTFPSWDVKTTAVGIEHMMVVAPGRGHSEAMLTGSDTADVARWNDMLTWLKAHTL